MALDYNRGNLLFEEDFTGDLSAFNIHELDGAGGADSYASVSVNGSNQLVLYAQHDGTDARDATSLPCDSIAAVETTSSWNRGAYMEVEFEYERNPTWDTGTDDVAKDPYVPGVEWGVLGSVPYDKVGAFARNYPIKNGWTSRFGFREWTAGGNTGLKAPQIAVDRVDDYDILDEEDPISTPAENSTHHMEAVAVDEEGQVELSTAGGSTYTLKNTLQEVIGAVPYLFASGENVGVKTDTPDQNYLFASGDEVALGVGGDYFFNTGSEIRTSEPVLVSDIDNHLILQNRIVNNSPDASSPGWTEVRIDYVKVWEAIPV